jgi:hypothetical protein
MTHRMYKHNLKKGCPTDLLWSFFSGLQYFLINSFVYLNPDAILSNIQTK